MYRAFDLTEEQRNILLDALTYREMSLSQWAKSESISDVAKKEFESQREICIDLYWKLELQPYEYEQRKIQIEKTKTWMEENKKKWNQSKS